MNKKLLLRNVFALTICLMISLTFAFTCRAEVIYENPETGYQAVIEDDANLFTAETVATFEEEMKALTEYGNVCVKTIDDNNKYSAKAYADAFYDERFGNTADGTIFLIDMDYRELVLTSEGRIKKDVTSAFADSIMDNVYTYASKGQYEICCQKAFAQELRLLQGKKIAQPMKYICNAFLAIIMSIILNYILVRLYSRKKKVKNPEFMLGSEESFALAELKALGKRKYKPSNSSISFGWLGGGSGGGHSHSHSRSYHSSGHHTSHHSSGGFRSGGHSHHSSGSHRF